MLIMPLFLLIIEEKVVKVLKKVERVIKPADFRRWF